MEHPDPALARRLAGRGKTPGCELNPPFLVCRVVIPVSREAPAVRRAGLRFTPRLSGEFLGRALQLALSEAEWVSAALVVLAASPVPPMEANSPFSSLPSHTVEALLLSLRSLPSLSEKPRGRRLTPALPG